MNNLSLRHPGPELMDGRNIPDKDLFQNYRELHTINKFLGGYNITLKGLNELVKDKNYEYRVLDVGCGGGDLICHMNEISPRKEWNVKWTGIDLSNAAVEYSVKNNSSSDISFIREDVFDHLRSGIQYDVIMSTLFMHHFTNERIAELLKLMFQSARAGIVINDLQRNPLAYYSIKLLTTLFSKSYLVKNDAPLSVLRSFKRNDWQAISQQANLSFTTFKWQWAFRYLIVIRK